VGKSYDLRNIFAGTNSCPLGGGKWCLLGGHTQERTPIFLNKFGPFMRGRCRPRGQGLGLGGGL
jgi:hypothetical protein